MWFNVRVFDNTVTIPEYASDLLVGDARIFPFEVFSIAAGGHLVEDHGNRNTRPGDHGLSVANTWINLDMRIHWSRLRENGT